MKFCRLRVIITRSRTKLFKEDEQKDSYCYSKVTILWQHTLCKSVSCHFLVLQSCVLWYYSAHFLYFSLSIYCVYLALGFVSFFGYRFTFSVQHEDYWFKPACEIASKRKSIQKITLQTVKFANLTSLTESSEFMIQSKQFYAAFKYINIKSDKCEF